MPALFLMLDLFLFCFFKNEKKEAFIVLKKGTQVSIVEAGYEVKAPNYNKK